MAGDAGRPHLFHAEAGRLLRPEPGDGRAPASPDEIGLLLEIVMRDFQTPGRSAVFAEKGMVATSHPAAAQAGLDVLREGGSAADAAVAASLVLAVAEPQNAGLGGDTFWMLADGAGRIAAYNGSGRLPSAFDPEAAGAIGMDSVHSVTIPGAVDALFALHAQYGRLPFEWLARPALTLAREGAIVLPRIAWDWAYGAARLAASPTACEAFGAPRAAGDRFVQPALARTLEALAAGGRQAFYRGPIAEGLTRTLRELGGFHTADDFAGHRGEAVTPIRTTYRGLEILECPPNGQGLTALLMLNLLQGLDMPAAWRDPAGYIHLLAQASQLAYAERDRWVCDPAFAEIPLARLLSPDHAASLRARLRGDVAQVAPPVAEAAHRDTVYLSVVDRDGQAVSFINSIFSDFGAAIYDAGSGLLLHNRGASFAREAGHPNAAAPGKRPMHTIIPALALKHGAPAICFGVMGGHYQAAGQAHLLSALLDGGLDPQEAMELPRHFHFGGVLELERGVPAAVAEALAAKGHEIRRSERPIGGAQAIVVDAARGVLIGGSDPRKDGAAYGY
jgi:gamma-glutamyltranspeptidase/glutathione hydrolase